MTLYVVITAVAVSLTTAAWLHWHKQAESLRRGRLQTRTVVEFDEWFEKYYATSGIQVGLVHDIYLSIAHALGVELTQLAPSDRFAVELGLGSNWLLDDSFEQCERDLPSIAAKYKRKIDKQGLRRCKTLGDLILYIGTSELKDGGFG